MKILEEIKHYGKEGVYDSYQRIVPTIKDYEKITKTKMLQAIYNEYQDYHNIIDICTGRELKFLKQVLSGKVVSLTLEQLRDDNYVDEYLWEKRNLREKFLVCYDYDSTNLVVPEEILPLVQKAVKNVNWKEKDKKDKLNEFLVGFSKTMGSIIVDILLGLGTQVTGMSAEEVYKHICYDRVFNYYFFMIEEYIKSMNTKKLAVIDYDFFVDKKELDAQRKKFAMAGTRPVDLNIFRTIFYHDFDIHNAKIKKFLTELGDLQIFEGNVLWLVKKYAMLNKDRTPLKQAIQSIPVLKDEDLTSFFKALDEAMDEMPSGALNGFTPNEAKQKLQERQEREASKKKSYQKQKGACLTEKDTKLFYKLYFGLLDFTNQKYKIKQDYKIYKQLGLDPHELIDIINKFWSNKEQLIMEFKMANPYHFSKEELKIVDQFRKGIRDIYIIAKFELEYTGFLTQDKVYMVKGINDNLDNIISYKELPQAVFTTILPFKNVLIYDGIFSAFPIDLKNSYGKEIEEDYSRLMKYYHL